MVAAASHSPQWKESAPYSCSYCHGGRMWCWLSVAMLLATSCCVASTAAVTPDAHTPPSSTHSSSSTQALKQTALTVKRMGDALQLLHDSIFDALDPFPAITESIVRPLSASLAGHRDASPEVFSLQKSSGEEDCSARHRKDCEDHVLREVPLYRSVTLEGHAYNPSQAANVVTGRRRANNKDPSTARRTVMAEEQSVDASTDVFTKATQIMNVLPVEISSKACFYGVWGVAADNSSQFRCVWYSASTGSTSNVTIGGLMYRDSISQAQRRNCSYVAGTSRNGTQCLCPADFFLFQSRPGFFGCLPRNISCATSWAASSPPFTCATIPYAAPEPFMSQCLSRSRGSAHVQDRLVDVTLRLSCSTSAQTQVGLFSAIGASVVTASNSSMAWMPTVDGGSRGGRLVDLDATIASSSPQRIPYGTFAALSVNPTLFPAVVAGNGSSTSLFLSQQHVAAQYGALEVMAFDFDRPHRSQRYGRWQFPLLNGSISAPWVVQPRSGLPFGASVNVSDVLRNGSWRLTFDVAQLPVDSETSSFFAAGRLYMEVGLVAPFGLERRYSVSPLAIEVPDAAPDPSSPPRTYSKKLDSATVAIIAVIVALVVGMVCGVIWFLWRRPDDDGDAMDSVSKKRRPMAPPTAPSQSALRDEEGGSTTDSTGSSSATAVSSGSKGGDDVTQQSDHAPTAADRHSRAQQEPPYPPRLGVL